MNRSFYKIIEDICEKDSRYKQDAYEFVMEVVTYTQKKYKRSKHVSGHELLKGTQDLLVEKFGPLTLTVLKHWGVNSTEDFGNIVFNLVENNVLSKTKDDKIDHFQDGFDFDEIFKERYRKQLAKKISRMR